METKIDSNTIARQIGCGYCQREKTYKEHNPNVNKAKQGCKDFKHYTTNNNNGNKTQKTT